MHAFWIIAFILFFLFQHTINSNNWITSWFGTCNAAAAAATLNVSVCAVSRSMSQAFHWVFRSLSQSTEPTSLPEPADYLSECDLDLLILISRRSKFQKANWIMSVISISWFSCGFTSVLGQTQIIGFLNLRLSALPDRFGEIKIFPVQWINVKTTLSLTLKMC